MKSNLNVNIVAIAFQIHCEINQYFIFNMKEINNLNVNIVAITFLKKKIMIYLVLMIHFYNDI